MTPNEVVEKVFSYLHRAVIEIKVKFRTDIWRNIWRYKHIDTGANFNCLLGLKFETDSIFFN